MFAENFGINYILAKKWTKEYSLQQFCLNVQKIISKSNLFIIFRNYENMQDNLNVKKDM